MSFYYLKKTKTLLLSTAFVYGYKGHSSAYEFPKIGDRLPLLLMNDLHYYSKTKASSMEFIGKPIIIDFILRRL